MSMRGQEFKARDKKVQKMTRDGLAEKNLAQGTQQRISGRQAEVSFGRERQGETAAGHRTQGRVQDQAHGRISSRRGFSRRSHYRHSREKPGVFRMLLHQR